MNFPLSFLDKNELSGRPLRRLGDASLSGFRVPYPGMNKVVRLARQWIENYRSEQFVRDKALQITGSIRKHSRTGHPDMRDFDAIAKAIHDFIVREVKYVRDQNGVERLQTPDATLVLKSGDCDDMVILGGALLESVGVPTRIKLIGQQPGKFSHIYLEYQSNGQWKSFDPTLALYPGFVYPKTNIKAEKTVNIKRPKKNHQSSIQNHQSLSCGSAFVDTSPGLGFDFAKAADVGIKAIDAGSKVAGLFGGGKGKNYGTGDCGEPVPSAVAVMLQNLPPAELSRLSSAYSSANKGKPLPNNSAEIAFAAYGGRDCRVTTSSGKSFKRIFDEQMSKYGPGGRSSQAGAINPLYLYAGGGILLFGAAMLLTSKKKEA